MIHDKTNAGKRISYSLAGQGPKVLLLHGFGEAGWVWKSIADKLTDHYTVLVPDLPGSGNSEAIDDMSIDGLAKRMYELMKEIGWEKCVLIGHSMGGYIALAWAEFFPESLRGLGLFHSSAFADSEEKKAVRRKGIRFIREHGATAFLESTSPNLFAPKTRDGQPELIDEFIRQTDNFLPDVLVSYYEAMMARPDRREQLIISRYPVLMVMGKHDQAVPIEDGLKLCSLPKKAYIHILSQSGHMGMLEEPNQSEQLLRHYLKDC